jgi:hypothetical protein
MEDPPESMGVSRSTGFVQNQRSKKMDIQVGNTSEDLTPISKAFDRLERNIHHLETAVTELVEKVKPVLGPEYGDGVTIDDGTIPDTSTLARLVDNYNDRVVALRQYVDGTRNRVEL